MNSRPTRTNATVTENLSELWSDEQSELVRVLDCVRMKAEKRGIDIADQFTEIDPHTNELWGHFRLNEQQDAGKVIEKMLRRRLADTEYLNTRVNINVQSDEEYVRVWWDY